MKQNKKSGSKKTTRLQKAKKLQDYLDIIPFDKITIPKKKKKNDAASTLSQTLIPPARVEKNPVNKKAISFSKLNTNLSPHLKQQFPLPMYIIRNETHNFDLAYFRGGAIRYFLRCISVGKTERYFRKKFTRKAQDIIILILAPIDHNHFEYSEFVLTCKEEAENNKMGILMDKLNFTVFNFVYDNWFAENDF